LISKDCFPLLPVFDRLRASAERLKAEMGVISDEVTPSFSK